MKTINTTIGEATIGFETFAEAEAFAKANNGEIRAFMRRAGEHTWQDRGWMNDTFELTAEDFVGGLEVFTSAEDYRASEEEFFEDFANGNKYLAKKYKEEIDRNADIFATLKEGEAVIKYENGTIEVFKQMTMGYEFDSKEFVIGVIKGEEE